MLEGKDIAAVIASRLAAIGALRGISAVLIAEIVPLGGVPGVGEGDLDQPAAQGIPDSVVRFFLAGDIDYRLVLEILDLLPKLKPGRLRRGVVDAAVSAEPEGRGMSSSVITSA